MKSNEAPEKLYMNWVNYPLEEMQVEYTRTDAFIEKAENYLRNTCQRFILTEKDIDDFVKYMKGE